MHSTTDLPVVVIGAGPVGLAAAAHLHERGIPTLVLEAGEDVGTSVRDWGHVRLFSPWRYSTDAASRRILRTTGWTTPDPDAHPTGNDLVDQYLRPLAASPQLAASIRTRHRVIGVARDGIGKLKTADREQQPFAVAVETPTGQKRLQARAVIDASGTWTTPNPIGADGLRVPGEIERSDRLAYGIPDVLGAERNRYAGRRVAVIGSGHSAQNVVRDLTELAAHEPTTEVLWLLRRDDVGQMFGGGSADGFAARGQLGTTARSLVDNGTVGLVTGFRIGAVETGHDRRVILVAQDGRRVGPFDKLIAATGFRPDLTFLRELRLALDPIVESTERLAPLIDPNLHSCGTVAPHGAAELAHPESGVYLVGMKSYGRAPTFLLATGYEQVRSVVAELAGDAAAAAAVELELPETGVCVSDISGSGAVGGCCATELTRPDASAGDSCCGPAPSEREPASVSPAPASSCCG